MKKMYLKKVTIVTFCLLWISVGLFAQSVSNYYVSNAGNDAGMAWLQNTVVAQRGPGKHLTR